MFSFFFFSFSLQTQNLAKVGSVFLATKGDTLNVYSLSENEDLLLIFANKTISKEILPEGEVGAFKCKDLPKYKHGTFQTSILAGGEGSFTFPSMGSFDFFVVDCYENISFCKAPVMKYHTHRTFLYVTIIVLIEMIFLVRIKISFLKTIQQSFFDLYLGHKFLDYFTTFLVAVDAIWVFMSFLKINIMKYELENYYNWFFLIKSMFLLFLGSIAISGYPIFDCTFSIRIHPLLVFVFTKLVNQHTNLSFKLLFPFAFLLIYIFNIKKIINEERVKKFKEQITNDKEMYNLLVKKGLFQVLFRIQESFKHHGMFMISLALLNPFFAYFNHWQEIQAISLSVGTVLWLRYMIHKVCSVEGIVLEKLVPSMIIEE